MDPNSDLNGDKFKDFIYPSKLKVKSILFKNYCLGLKTKIYNGIQESLKKTFKWYSLYIL